MCPLGQGQTEDENMAAVPIRPKSRLGVCEVCKEVEAKYTCPSCECTTCSLECSKKHKKDNDCDGVRIRTSFVKLNEFGNLHLLSDYRLLDDISCKVDTCHRDKLKKGGNQPHQQHCNKFTKLKHAVLSRGADLVILPNQFVRHKSNTSIFDVRIKQIKWRVQLTFLNASRFTIYEERCSEETLVGTLLEKYLLNSPPDSNSLVQKKLETYRKLGLSQITALMKAERVPASDKKFYKLDPEKTLRENFVGKTIVEFPQLFLVLTGCFTVHKAPKYTLNPGKTLGNFLIPSNSNGSMERMEQSTSTVLSSSEESDEFDEDDQMDFGGDKLPSYRDLLLQRQS